MGALKIEDIPQYTYDDYKHWEDRWELINGYPYAMAPMPMLKHKQISNKIAWQLEEILKDCNKCQAYLPVDWKISDDTIVQPDNSVICHTPQNEAYISKAPTMIFEILSKSTAKKDLTIKYNLYEKEGVKYYIIINPDDNIAKIYSLLDGRYIKLCDTTNDMIEFVFDKCKNSVNFDFGRIW